MIRVAAPSRLHFGLFHLGTEESWPNIDGQPILPARRFGGVGLMADEPGLVVRAKPAPAWRADGPLADRALEFARRFVALMPAGMPAQHLRIETSPPEHAGLGVGTQLGLAVAKALAAAASQTELSAVELARRVGRGARSAVGIHGFQAGGLIVEGGKSNDTQIAPLLVRAPFPDDWRLVIAVPRRVTPWHGENEREAFATLGTSPPPRTVDQMCRTVLLGLLPALAEGDCPAFGEALYEFNARAGEAFFALQGGRYAHPMTAEMIAFLRGQNVHGVGQSSWGPTVFAVLPDEERARHVLQRLTERFTTQLAHGYVTRANNAGASTQALPDE